MDPKIVLWLSITFISLTFAILEAQIFNIWSKLEGLENINKEKEKDTQRDIRNIEKEILDLNKRIEKFTTINKDTENTNKELKKLLEDINSQGTGFFEIRHVKEDEYYHRIDPMLIYKK